MTAIAENPGVAIRRMPNLFAALKSAWLAWMDRAQRCRDLQRTIAHLEHLDARMLQDIGLTRGDLAFLSRRDIILRRDF